MKECMEFPEALAICCQIIANKKCIDPKIFEGISGIADYMVLTTCTSETHLRAMGDELYRTFKHRYGQLCRVDYQPLSGWLVFDAFDVVLHAFTESMRQKYDLDGLFGRSNILAFEYVLPLDICSKSLVSPS
jgi:ribosome-associated protein